ncbi:MAG: CDP-glucose 4,6-dehydratase [Gammaproteobacteria bacterium]|nr:CDP-glucose 4,6-dehydratase [Gammaproteobacteria bacterium]
MDPAFWRGRRVLVSGHTGFKGAWLSLWLQRLGARVYGYALAPATEPSLFELAGVASGMQSHIADVRDLPRLAQELRAIEPDVVLHLAAQALVLESYRDPVATYATNVMGTVHLLEAARAVAGLRAIVVVTSDKCYENREWSWPYRENDPLGGHDPYASSKACAELVTSAYRNAFADPAGERTGVASARAGNVVGGGDWAADRLLPDLVRAFTARRRAAIRNPEAIRPWQHVLEPLGAYLHLAERLAGDPARCARAWNFGPDPIDTRTVRWVADRVAALWGDGAAWEQDPGSRPHEARSLRLDCSLAAAELGWRPSLGLEEALAWTVEWYRAAAADPARAAAITCAQIDAYMERIRT